MPIKGGMIRVIAPLIHSVRCFEGGQPLCYLPAVCVVCWLEALIQLVR